MRDVEETRLTTDQLRKRIDESMFAFETTEEVDVLESIIGQKRGESVMEFGLQVDKFGYNVYVAGLSGTGKMTFSRSIVNQFAKNKVQLFDFCYVNNFLNNDKPKMLKLPVGMGRQLKEDMASLVENLQIDIPRTFRDESYQQERNALLREYKNKTNAIIEEINDIAKGYDFMIRHSDGGLFTIPIIEGSPITEEEYAQLDEVTLREMEEKSATLQDEIIDYTKRLRRIEQEMRRSLEQLDKDSVLTAIRFHIDDLKESYHMCKNVLHYLDEVQSDVLKHHTSFTQVKEDNETKQPMQLMMMQQKSDVRKRYEVNLLVNHETTEGAPVVIADNPTFYHLMGKIEYESQMGVMNTHYTKIKSGYLHEANGGYLIIQIKDILMKPYAWDSLKRALLTKEIQIEHMNDHAGVTSTTTLNPEPVPLDVKVVLVGSREIYELLYANDEDFRKLFKIRADFDVEMAASKENMMKLARFIHTHSEKQSLRPFHRSAVARLVEYSMRLSGSQDKLSTRFNEQVEIIYEADTWAQLSNDSIVSANHIQKAIEERAYRNSLYEEKVQESIDHGQILIDTTGDKVGQVNGLAVYHIGQYRFGKPSRITVTTFLGRKGVVNIERESELSGKVHNKGVYILSGYLGETFAQDTPLALTAHITFEQNYGGIDGDSASSAELYALLSSLSDLPLDQGIAVTGSVNQKGEIQPIGGVNEKIEGFYKTCKQQGLTGNQGVIIPKQNMKHLMLAEEIVSAVRDNQFHIYAVQSIEQGIEILTGVPAKHALIKDDYHRDSVFKRVAEKLNNYAKRARENRKY